MEALIAIFTLVLTIVGALFIPETYASVLLRQRAQRLSLATGRSYRSKFEKNKRVEIGQLFKTALGRPWVLLFKEPVVFLLSLYLAIVYATLYMLFGAFPIVFQQQRGWSPGVGGLAFLGVLVGFMIALAYTIFYENPRYSKKLNAEGGWLPPEQRLPPAILGGILLPIVSCARQTSTPTGLTNQGLFSFAWTAAPARIHWIAPIICSAPFGCGMVLVFLSCFNYLIDGYLLHAASVLAANSVLRSLFGVGFPLFVSPMFQNLGVNWACTLIAFLALACAPLPLLVNLVSTSFSCADSSRLFFLKGRGVRRLSHHGRQADEMGQMMRQAAMKRKGDTEGQ